MVGTQGDSMHRASRWPVGTFLVVLVATSSLFWAFAWMVASGAWPFGPPKAREWFVTGLMWCPALAALIACTIARTPYARLGTRLPRGRWLGIAYLYPVAYLLVAYAIVWMSGFGSFDPAVFAEDAAKRFPFAGASSTWVAVLATLSIGVLVEMGRSLGEELGWRGLLAPAWTERWGLAVGGLASGLVWGLWHLPLLTAFGFGELPVAYAIGCFLVSIVSLGYVCAWLRQRSRSVWPAVVVHAVHNALMYPLFEMMTGAGERTAYASGETGFALALANVGGALLVWRSTRRIAVLQTR